MRDTSNEGSSDGAAPNGAMLDPPATDFFEIKGDAVRGARAHFDVGTTPEQLGQA